MVYASEQSRFSDQWGGFYVEHVRIEQEHNGLVMVAGKTRTELPFNQVSVLRIGPGTTITHAATRQAEPAHYP